MTCVLFAHRDAEFFAPKLRSRFPQLTVLTAPDLPDADDRLGEADVIMATGHLFNDRRLQLAQKLRWIHTMTTGFDSIILSDALRPEILLTTTRGIHGPQTSEMAILYMMNLARGVPRMIENQRKHVWKRWTQVRLYGKTVAILGMGVIAEALAPRCKALGMTVLGVTRTPRQPAGFDRVYRYDQLKEAAAQADFLVVLAPHARETESIIDAGVLASMKKSAFLVNLARGAVCDEDALLAALREKRIAGAGLDVFRKEPLPADSPFWDLENVMISAHCSGSSDDNLAITWPIIETNMACFLEGRSAGMINLVSH
jgi:D-2-hydroxyacid dehydrogenase (NADP+)